MLRRNYLLSGEGIYRRATTNAMFHVQVANAADLFVNLMCNVRRFPNMPVKATYYANAFPEVPFKSVSRED